MAYNHLKDYLKSLEELGNDPDVESELRSILALYERGEAGTGFPATRSYVAGSEAAGSDLRIVKELKALLDLHDASESLVFDVRVRQATQEDIDTVFNGREPMADVETGACAIENLGVLVAVANEFGTIYFTDPSTGYGSKQNALERIVTAVSDALAIYLPTRHRPEEAQEVERPTQAANDDPDNADDVWV